MLLIAIIFLYDKDVILVPDVAPLNCYQNNLIRTSKDMSDQ